jgi:multidrug resistance efflux pump
VAQVKLAHADVERAKPLLGTSAISERAYDQRAAELAVAQAKLQVARSVHCCRGEVHDGLQRSRSGRRSERRRS